MPSTLLDNSVIFTVKGPQICKKILDQELFAYIDGELKKIKLVKSGNKVDNYSRIYLSDGTYFDTTNNDYKIGNVVNIREMSSSVSPNSDEILLSEIASTSPPVSPSKSLKKRFSNAIKRISKSMSADEGASPTDTLSYSYGRKMGRRRECGESDKCISLNHTQIFDDYLEKQFNIEEVIQGWKDVNDGIVVGKYEDIYALHSLLKFNSISSVIRSAGLKYTLEIDKECISPRIVKIEKINSRASPITVSYIV